MKNKIEFYFRPIYQFFWRTTFAFEYVIFILNLQIALKLKRKLFFKNSLKIGRKIIRLRVVWFSCLSVISLVAATFCRLRQIKNI